MKGAAGIIAEKLGAYEKRRKLFAVGVAVSRTLLIFAAEVAVCMLVDFLFLPQDKTRFLLTASVAVSCLAYLTFKALKILRKRPLKVIASEVEQRAGCFDEKLVAALSFAQQEHNWMAAQTIKQAEAAVAATDLRIHVDDRKILAARKLVLVSAVFLVALAAIPGVSPLFLRALNPRANIGRPGGVEIKVSPGNIVVEKGAPVKIEALVSGKSVQPKIALKWEDGLEEEALMLRNASGIFDLKFDTLNQSVEYVVRAGRSESERYRISLAVPPKLEKVQWQMRPPAYTRKGMELSEDSEIKVLEGTKVSFKAIFSGEPLQRAHLGLQNAVIKAESVEWSGTPTNSINFKLNFTGKNGVSAEKDFGIQVTQDLKPTVKFAGDKLSADYVSANETLAYKIEATDDVGLTNVVLIVRSENGHQQVHSLKLDQQPLTASQTILVKLGIMPLKLGEKVIFVAEAFDSKGQPVRTEERIISVAGLDFQELSKTRAGARSMLAEMGSQIESFERMQDALLSLKQSARFAESLRPELLYLEENLLEAIDLISALALEMKKQTNNLADGFSLRNFGTTLWEFSQANRAILQTNIHNAIAVAAKDSPPMLQQGRDLAGWTIGELKELTNDFHFVIRFLDGNLAAQKEEVRKARYNRLAALVKSYEGWTAGGKATVEEMVQLPPGELAAARAELKSLGSAAKIPDLSGLSNALAKVSLQHSWGEPLARLNFALNQMRKAAGNFRAVGNDEDQQRKAEAVADAWIAYLGWSIEQEERNLDLRARGDGLNLAQRTAAIAAAHRLDLAGEKALTPLQKFRDDFEFNHPGELIRKWVEELHKEAVASRAAYEIERGPAIPLGEILVERLGDYRADKLRTTQFVALLEGERQRANRNYPMALSYSEIGKDMGPLIVDPAQVTHQAIDALRLRAMELLKGEIKLGVKIPENESLLEQLAQKAREAAERAEKRPEFRNKLEDIAAVKPTNTNLLSELESRKTELLAEEKEARINFSAAEEAMAKRSSRLQHKFSGLVTALAKEALGPEVTIDQLAARAHQAALMLQDEVAVPAAREFKKDPTPANGDYGKRVARLVYDQHQAAEILDKIARAKKEIEKKLNELSVESAAELARKTASSSSNNRADAAGQLAEEAATEALAAVEAKPEAESSYAEAAEILAKAAQQGRLAAASSHAAASGSKASTADTADVDSETGRFEGEGGGGGLALAIAPKGIDQADWARLPDNVKRQIRHSGSIESFSPEMQRAIRAYFKKLALQ